MFAGLPMASRGFHWQQLHPSSALPLCFLPCASCSARNFVLGLQATTNGKLSRQSLFVLNFPPFVAYRDNTSLERQGPSIDYPYSGLVVSSLGIFEYPFCGKLLACHFIMLFSQCSLSPSKLCRSGSSSWLLSVFSQDFFCMSSSDRE